MNTNDRSASDPIHHGDGRAIGMVAGWGRLPIIVAQELKRQGYRVYCLGVSQHADGEALSAICDDFRWTGLGRLGAAVRYFRRHQVTLGTMGGKYQKKLLYQPWFWLRHLPDLTAIRHFYGHFVTTTKDRKDDTLLGALVSAFATYGITFQPATDFVPELLVKLGQLTQRGISTSQQKDIHFGWSMAKEMGRLDVGQSVMVKDRAVLAVEAIEGTDLCIRRAGQLCASGGFTVVKVAKPNQDMRFDVPTIGVGTLQTMVEAGGRVLAIEAGKTIIVDSEEFIQFANEHKLAVIALDEPSRVTAAA